MVDKVKNSFRKIYENEAVIVVKSPGRINLIGEHTDYNGGLVLPAAIDKCMYFALAENDLNLGRIYAMDLDEKSIVYFDQLEKTETIWLNYIIGMLLEFKNLNFALKGFDCVFSSEIPIGAGMSSSAALECGFAVGMDAIIGSNLKKWQIIDMSHHSNHSFMNIYGGILDQFSLLFGQVGKCMLMNCKDRSFDFYNIDLLDYQVVLINTNVKHEHTLSGYNDRAEECKSILSKVSKKYKEIECISDVMIDNIDDVTEGLEMTLKRRVKFIVEENNRVLQFINAMERNDIIKLGDLLYQSHNGLQYLYEVSCPELDTLVDITRDINVVIGSRMMGGGFGGCTINLIKSEIVESTVNYILDEYQLRTGIKAESFFVNISDGVEVIEL